MKNKKYIFPLVTSVIFIASGITSFILTEKITNQEVNEHSTIDFKTFDYSSYNIETLSNSLYLDTVILYQRNNESSDKLKEIKEELDTYHIDYIVLDPSNINNQFISSNIRFDNDIEESLIKVFLSDSEVNNSNVINIKNSLKLTLNENNNDIQDIFVNKDDSKINNFNNTLITYNNIMSKYITNEKIESIIKYYKTRSESELSTLGLTKENQELLISTLDKTDISYFEYKKNPMYFGNINIFHVYKQDIISSYTDLSSTDYIISSIYHKVQQNLEEQTIIIN